MSKKIFVTRPLPHGGIDIIKSKGFEVDVNPDDKVLSQDELISYLQKNTYDGVVSLLTDKIDAKFFDAVPSVKIVSNYAIGYNNIDVAEATKRGVVVTNAPGPVQLESVAEHAFALILSLAHRITEGDSFVKAGKYEGWNPNLLVGTNIRGMTLGLVGLGRIGAQVAHHAKAFGLTVLYYDVIRNEQAEKEGVAVYEADLNTLLGKSDVVSVHVPLMDSTKHLINAERLSAMKKNTILVNTSRGPVVDEVALVGALQNGTIRGAGLDVYEFEPKLAKGLAELSNVVLTPHIASATEGARIEMATKVAENLEAFFAGTTVPNLVLK